MGNTFPSRASTALLGVLVCLFALGCESDNLLSGVWRSTQAAEGDRVIAPASGFNAVGVELVVGHYGPDVSGLLRFYRRDNFESSRDPFAPASQCACSYIHQGRWSGASSRLTFTIKGCLPGQFANEELYTLGDFQWASDETTTLQGTLTVEDPASSLYGSTQSWRFERVSSVSASDLNCPKIQDVERGNIANGQ